MTADAEIISVGSELLSGRVTDTNAAYISRELAACGIRPRFHSTVGDRMEEIAAALAQALRRADCVVVTGGIGPTMDDITREAAAAALGRKLVFHKPSLDHIRRVFRQLGRAALPGEDRQAYYPAGGRVLANRLGTAPGFFVKAGRRVLVALPGVPGEMRAMFRAARALLLEAVPAREPLACRLVHVFGMPESHVAERLREVFDDRRGVDFGITAQDMVVTVSLTAPADKRPKLTACVRRIRRRLGDYVFGTDATTLARAVVRLLKRRSLTLAVAESCTGGLVAGRITSVSGASEVFIEGFVTYSNRAKVARLGVGRALLRRHGAVSEQVARAMAEGARRAARADVAVADTGIAGPAGGSRARPVGLVYIALATTAGVDVRRFHFPGTREDVRSRAANTALNLVRVTVERQWR